MIGLDIRHPNSTMMNQVYRFVMEINQSMSYIEYGLISADWSGLEHIRLKAVPVSGLDLPSTQHLLPVSLPLL